MNPIDRRALLKRFREAQPTSKSERRSYSPSSNLLNESFDAAESAVSAAELAVESTIYPYSSRHDDAIKINGIEEDVITRALAVIDRSRKAFDEGLAKGLESRGLHSNEGSRSTSGSGVSTISLPAPRAAAIPSLSLKRITQATSPVPIDVTSASSQDADGDVVSLLASSSYKGKQSLVHNTRDSVLSLGFASSIPGLTLQQQSESDTKNISTTTTSSFPHLPFTSHHADKEYTLERPVASVSEFNVKADTLDVSSELATAVLNLSMPLDLTSIPNAAANEFEENQMSVDSSTLLTNSNNVREHCTGKDLTIPTSIAQLFSDSEGITFESTAEQIALEDPEVTVERLRRRLAAIDDALMPKMASYLPSSSSSSSGFAFSQAASLAAVTDATKAEEPTFSVSTSAYYVSPPHSPPRHHHSTPSASAALSTVSSPTNERRHMPMVLIYDPALNAYVPADASITSERYFNNASAKQLPGVSSQTATQSDSDKVFLYKQYEEAYLPQDPPPLQRHATIDIQTSSAIVTPQRRTPSRFSTTGSGSNNVNDNKYTSQAAASIISSPRTTRRRESQSVAGASSIRSTQSTESLLARLRSVRVNATQF